MWGSLLAGVVSLVAFIYLEARVESPLVPLQLFSSRDFSGANLLTLFLYAALGIFFFLFSLNLIQMQHYSATATGAAALPLIGLMFLLSRWSGGLVTRLRAKTAAPCRRISVLRSALRRRQLLDDGPRVIRQTRQYILDFQELAGKTATAKELYDQMLARYPDWLNRGALWSSAGAIKS